MLRIIIYPNENELHVNERDKVFPHKEDLSGIEHFRIRLRKKKNNNSRMVETNENCTHIIKTNECHSVALKHPFESISNPRNNHPIYSEKVTISLTLPIYLFIQNENRILLNRHLAHWSIPIKSPLSISNGIGNILYFTRHVFWLIVFLFNED